MKTSLVTLADAGARIQFLANGQVLAETLAYDSEHAEVTARILWRDLSQFDSVLLAPVHRTSDRLSEEARRSMKRAYKDGLLK